MKLATSPANSSSAKSSRGRRAAVKGFLLLILLLVPIAACIHVRVASAPAPAAAKAPAAPAPAPVPASAQATLPEALPELAVAAAPLDPVAPAVTVREPLQVPGLSRQVLAMALDAVSRAQARGLSGRDDLLTVIDYSLPSTEPRLWVLDLAHGEVLYRELVAHGSGSGELYATHFSNLDESRQTSLGLFRTAGTYEGGNGYSLVLQGMDPGVNDRAEQRHIVMHGAWYVSPEHARQQGRLGRSWGCPALSLADAPKVIDTIKGGSFLFAYGADRTWLKAALPAGGSSGDSPVVAAAR